MTYRIALYGFGSFPVVFRHLIEQARSDGSGVEFCAILTAPNYRKVMREVLPQTDILDIYMELPRRPVGGDPLLLSHYDGSLIEDLAALKWERRKRPRSWRYKRGLDYYRLYKDFLSKQHATHLLMSGIETPDAKIAVAAAQELGIGIIAPADLRNLTGTYFSIDAYETPPSYARANAHTRRLASAFVQDFRLQARPARDLPSDVAGDCDESEQLVTYLPTFAARVRGFAAAAIERPDLFDPEMIRVSLMRSFAPIRMTIRGVRRRRNEGQFDIANVAALPHKFIFYPLQYTPESSINVPAPYFVDQFRVIDALRFAMPSDFTLLVKEHPACLEMRPAAFMRRLRNLVGVQVIKVTTPSTELIRRAALTVTVTGTAAFEAFLLGRPAMVLGPGMPAWVRGGVTSLGDLRKRIVEAIDHPLPDDFVIEQIAKLLDVRNPFFCATAHMPGEPMLRRGNIRRFWAAIVDHLERDRIMKLQRLGAHSEPAATP
jgi:hypothetical protein